MSGHCDRRASGTFPFIILGGGLDCPPLRASREAALILQLHLGSRQTFFHCAHRATTVLSWGLCEQEGWLPTPSPPFFHLDPIAPPV